MSRKISYRRSAGVCVRLLIAEDHDVTSRRCCPAARARSSEGQVRAVYAVLSRNMRLPIRSYLYRSTAPLLHAHDGGCPRAIRPRASALTAPAPPSTPCCIAWCACTWRPFCGPPRQGAVSRAFVEREFRQFITCGVWAKGFARFRCDGCQAERLVPFSCKARAVCPSCGGRRMAERAAGLVDHVLPAVPIRQWVLSLPFRLRYVLAWDHALCRKVLAVHVRALRAFYRRRARRAGITTATPGRSRRFNGGEVPSISTSIFIRSSSTASSPASRAGRSASFPLRRRRRARSRGWSRRSRGA